MRAAFLALLAAVLSLVPFPAAAEPAETTTELNLDGFVPKTVCVAAAPRVGACAPPPDGGINRWLELDQLAPGTKTRLTGVLEWDAATPLSRQMTIYLFGEKDGQFRQFNQARSASPISFGTWRATAGSTTR